jgi:hypothetical protein
MECKFQHQTKRERKKTIRKGREIRGKEKDERNREM